MKMQTLYRRGSRRHSWRGDETWVRKGIRSAEGGQAETPSVEVQGATAPSWDAERVERGGEWEGAQPIRESGEHGELPQLAEPRSNTNFSFSKRHKMPLVEMFAVN